MTVWWKAAYSKGNVSDASTEAIWIHFRHELLMSANCPTADRSGIGGSS